MKSHTTPAGLEKNDDLWKSFRGSQVNLVRFLAHPNAPLNPIQIGSSGMARLFRDTNLLKSTDNEKEKI